MQPTTLHILRTRHRAPRANRRAAGLLLLVAAILWMSLAVDLAAGTDEHPHTAQAATKTDVAPRTTDPDAACARCHAAIVGQYSQTTMARGSGPAVTGLLPGSYEDQPSGVAYKVFLQDDNAWMSFHRATTSAGPALDGQRLLQYFIGSGRRGRTYLYQQEGLWFELPVNFYTRRHAWDMAPNYSGQAHMPAPLPVDRNCLHCHSTLVAANDGPARNAFAGAPFAQGGIGCSACHGDPTAHLAAGGHGPILNPGKLDPDRRDSACIQCHLEGDAVVYRPGRSLAQFQPGDRLADFAVYFVRKEQVSGGARATSQYEALLQSACKRAVGERLTCTTCHDPHSSPAPAERVAFYRARCLSCHTSPALAVSHHPEQPDCATCHMPTRNTADISHEQVTDHNIERQPTENKPVHTAGATLVPVGGFAVGDRELGLAYAQMAQRGDRAAGERALQLLQRASSTGAADEQVSLHLGFLYQLSGDSEQARQQYTRTLELNPHEPVALSNLAVLEASAGHVSAAVHLLSTLVAADKSQTAAGMNLALLQCSLGNAHEAHDTAASLLPLNPDSPQVRSFLAGGCAAISNHSKH